MRVLSSLLGAALIGAVAAGPAMSADGFYVAPQLGMSFLPDRDFTAEGFDGTLRFDRGWQAGGAIGYRLGMVRVEVEGGYGEANLKTIRLADVGEAVFADKVSHTAGFLNAYVDLPVPVLSPFVGGGVGVVKTDFDDIQLESDDALAGVFADSEENLALHGEAGLNIAITDLVTVAPSYRFVWVDDGDDGLDASTSHQVRLTARIHF